MAAGHHPHDRHADHDADQLQREAVVGRLVLRQVGDRRGGQHHDKAEDQQQRGNARDQVVRGERPVEQRARRAEPVAEAVEGATDLAGGGRRRVVRRAWRVLGRAVIHAGIHAF
jgi:hypothetical protein